MVNELKFADSMHNVVAFLEKPTKEHEFFQPAIDRLKNCRLTRAISTNPIIYKELITEFWQNFELVVAGEGDNSGDMIMTNIKGTNVLVSEQTIREVLGFGDLPSYPTEYSIDQVKAALTQMGYQGRYTPLFKNMLPPFWRLIAHTYFHCISGRKSGSDELSQVISSGVVAFIMDWNYNYSKYIFEEMKGNMTEKRLDPFLKYPRFIQMILNAMYPDIPRTGDTLDVKNMGPTTFKALSSNRQKSKFNPTLPWYRVGIFAEDANVVIPDFTADAQPSAQPAAEGAQIDDVYIPTHADLGMNEAPESPHETKPVILRPPSNLPDITTTHAQPTEKPTQFTVEIVLSDDEDEEDIAKDQQEDQSSEAVPEKILMTEAEFKAMIKASITEGSEADFEAECARQATLQPLELVIDLTDEPDLEDNLSVIDETTKEEEHDDTLVQRKRRKLDSSVEENVEKKMETAEKVTENVEKEKEQVEKIMETEASETEKETEAETVIPTEPVVVKEKAPEDKGKGVASSAAEQIVSTPSVRSDFMAATEFVPASMLFDIGAGGSTSGPSSSQPGRSSSVPTGSFTQLLSGDFVFDEEPVDVVRLQQRVFTLEQENQSKDVLIGNLDGQIKDLQRDNLSLQENLGNLTAMFFELKGILQFKFGKDFADKKTPAATRPATTTTPAATRSTTSTAPASKQSTPYTVATATPSTRPLHPIAEENFRESRARALEHQEAMREFFESEALTADELREKQRKFAEKRKRKEVMIVSDINMAEPPKGKERRRTFTANKGRFATKYGNRSGIMLWAYDDVRALWYVKRKNYEVEYYSSEHDFSSWTKVDLIELSHAPFYNPSNNRNAWAFKHFLTKEVANDFPSMPTAKSFLKKAKHVRDSWTGRTVRNTMWPATKKVIEVPVKDAIPDGSLLGQFEYWIFEEKYFTVAVKTHTQCYRLIEPKDLLMFGERDIRILAETQIRVLDDAFEEYTKAYSSTAQTILAYRLWSGATDAPEVQTMPEL